MLYSSSTSHLLIRTILLILSLEVSVSEGSPNRPRPTPTKYPNTSTQAPPTKKTMIETATTETIETTTGTIETTTGTVGTTTETIETTTGTIETTTGTIETTTGTVGTTTETIKTTTGTIETTTGTVETTTGTIETTTGTVGTTTETIETTTGTIETTGAMPSDQLSLSFCSPDEVDGRQIQATRFSTFECTYLCATTRLIKGVRIGQLTSTYFSETPGDYYAVKHFYYDSTEGWSWSKASYRFTDEDFQNSAGRVLCNRPTEVNRWVPYENQPLSTLPYANIQLTGYSADLIINAPVCAYHYEGNMIAGIAWYDKGEEEYFCSAMVVRSDDSQYTLEAFSDNYGEVLIDKAKGPLEYILVKAPANNPPVFPACVSDLNWFNPMQTLSPAEPEGITQAVDTYPPETVIHFCEVFGFNSQQEAFTRELGLELPRINYQYTPAGTTSAINRTLPGGCLLTNNGQIHRIPFVPPNQDETNTADTPFIQYHRLSVPVDSGWINATSSLAGSPAGCSNGGASIETAYLCRFIDTNRSGEQYAYGVTDGNTCQAISLTDNGNAELVYEEINSQTYQVYFQQPIVSLPVDSGATIVPLPVHSAATKVSLGIIPFLLGFSLSQLQ